MIKFVFLFILKRKGGWEWSWKLIKLIKIFRINYIICMKCGKLSEEFGIIGGEGELMVIGFLNVVFEFWKWFFNFWLRGLICLLFLKKKIKKMLKLR